MRENPDYQFSTSFNEGILEIVFTGELTRQTLDLPRAEIMTLIQENNAHAVLFDCCRGTGPHEIFDAYYRVRSLPAHIKMLPVAIVDKSVDFHYQSFFEATAANAGMTVKWFTDAKNARAWLKNKLNHKGTS